MAGASEPSELVAPVPLYVVMDSLSAVVFNMVITSIRFPPILTSTPTLFRSSCTTCLRLDVLQSGKARSLCEILNCMLCVQVRVRTLNDTGMAVVINCVNDLLAQLHGRKCKYVVPALNCGKGWGRYVSLQGDTSAYPLL